MCYFYIDWVSSLPAPQLQTEESFLNREVSENSRVNLKMKNTSDIGGYQRFGTTTVNLNQ
jgi:hypothetical protein